MSITINHKQFEIPGLKTISWVENPQRVKYITDKNDRTKWLRAIVAHTCDGKLGKLLPGIGVDSGRAATLARYQINTDRQVSWDFTEEMDGTWLIQNDPLVHYSWQATTVNPITCGFEMVQFENGDMYEEQIKKAVLFVDALTALLGIQRQIPWDKVHDKPILGVIDRIAGTNAGHDVVGIYSHSMQTSNRGIGDCGPWLFLALKEAGYELFDLHSEEDLKTWEQRQLDLGITNPDGLPGPATITALKTAGKKHGMWVKRPIDDLLLVEGV
jgi:hypothetical protein